MEYLNGVSVINAIAAISSVVLACLTAILALHTKTLALEAKKTREQQIEPCVIVSAIHDSDRPSVIMLVIRNIGNGLALDVEFECSKKLKVCWGIDGNREKPKEVEGGPFVIGIPSLGPGETRIMNWGQFGGLHAEYGAEQIRISCKFKDKDNKKLHIESKIDIASFSFTIANDSLEYRKVKAIEAIVKNGLTVRLEGGH